MNYNHPPVKKLRHRPEEKSVMETIVYHLSPEQIGRIGGEMARQMVNAAQSYLEGIAVQEVKQAFSREIHEGIHEEPLLENSFANTNLATSPSAQSPANQYRDDNGPH